jgi:hypothetical protein
MLGVLVLVGALAVVFAGPASAYTHKQKRHIQRALLHQLKKHPRLIKNRHWLRKADHVQEVLPLTIRLNPLLLTATGIKQAASDDSASLDFSDTFGPDIGGAKSTTLNGVVKTDAHFGNPENGDTLGSVRLVVTGADLSAASVGVLSNSAANSCTTPSPDWTYTAGGTATSSSGSVSAASLAPSVHPDTVVRTAPISLSLAGTSAPNVGTANLFSGDLALSLHVNAAVNTIFRVLDNGTGFNTNVTGGIPTALFNCDEAIAAETSGTSTTNIIPVDVTGNLSISPALTTDGKLRIATVTASTPSDTSGIEVGHSSVDACLQPYALVDTGTGPGGSQTHVSQFESAVGAALPSPPPASAEVVGSPPNPTSTGNPAAECNFPWTPSIAAPLALLGEQEISPGTAKLLHLDPNVSVTHLSAEALIGTYNQ